MCPPHLYKNRPLVPVTATLRTRPASFNPIAHTAPAGIGSTLPRVFPCAFPPNEAHKRGGADGPAVGQAEGDSSLHPDPEGARMVSPCLCQYRA